MSLATPLGHPIGGSYNLLEPFFLKKWSPVPGRDFIHSLKRNCPEFLWLPTNLLLNIMAADYSVLQNLQTRKNVNKANSKNRNMVRMRYISIAN